jgi:hypothetical protein
MSHTYMIITPCCEIRFYIAVFTSTTCKGREINGFCYTKIGIDILQTE